MPKHVGIIMDGNGRWAKRKKLPRIYGHKNAIHAVHEIVETAAKLGIDVLTLYAFSTENWGRPEKEVSFLMKLFEEFLKKELSTLSENNIRFQLLGNQDRLPGFLDEPLEKAYQKTSNNTGTRLCLAVDYGSRDEIVQACRQIAVKVAKGELKDSDINEALVSDHLFTQSLDDPDLIIRSSGELRLSNFMLWQAAYSEFFFTSTLWPDFRKIDFYEALEEFSKRKRRKGKVGDDE